MRDDSVLTWRAREILAWNNADPARQVVDEKLEAVMERVVEVYEELTNRS